MIAPPRFSRGLHPHILLAFLVLSVATVSRAADEQPATQPVTQPATQPATAEGFFNVRSFGATGDGKTLDSPSINQAIEACGQAGGGTVHLPAGTYLCGSIHLKSNLHILLDAGATIMGAPQFMKAYDPAEPFSGKSYQDGGHTYFHNSLIWGEDLDNVSITGSGVINGGDLSRDDRDKPGQDQNGNKSIALKRCRNVLFRDITILHGGHFAILATGIDGMTVDNVTMDTNRDGIDIDCCRNTTVSNCRINSPVDDGLCPKSSYALGENRITENLTITNCQVSGFKEGTLVDGTMVPAHGCGRIKLGTESNGGFRNVTISNCTFRGCYGLALEEVDGGILENITITNIAMTDVVMCPIYIALGSRNRGPNVEEPSRMRNILISNLTATGIDHNSGVQITGMPGHNIEGVRLDNIRLVFKGGGTQEEAARVVPELAKNYPDPRHTGVMPAYAVFARHVTGLELSNFNASYEKDDLRPAIECVDVNGLEIDNFKAQIAAAAPVSKFESIHDLVIRDSPELNPAAGQPR